MLRRDVRPASFARPRDERDASFVAPDRRGSKDAVAVGMIEVAVCVDDDRDPRRRQFAYVPDDLARLRVRRTSVDDHDAVAAEHYADVLVEERVPPHEDAIADLDPASHRRMVAVTNDGAGLDKL